MEIILFILIWLAMGAAGVALCRARWYRNFGDYFGQEWTRPFNIFCILVGPCSLFAGILFYIGV